MRALDSPFGIIVSTNNFEQARSLFYRVKGQLKSKIPTVELLSARVSPNGPTELWIVKSPTSESPADVQGQ